MKNSAQIQMLVESIERDKIKFEGIKLSKTEKEVLQHFSGMNTKTFPTFYGDVKNNGRRNRLKAITKENLIKKGLVEHRYDKTGWDYYRITVKGTASLW